MSRSHFLLSVALCLPFLRVALSYEWPDLKHDALEKIIYEGGRPDGALLFSALKNCSIRFTPDPGDPPHNETTASAGWLRLAYHDMATHNVVDGTGGIDSSIFYEIDLDRPENVGNTLRISMVELATFSSKYVSRSDVIAIGAAMAVADCGGPVIPIRGGRIDATGPGPAGVPQPHQDLQTHTEKFRLQGFNPTEMIEMVACGHTLGGVESFDFPSVVDDPPDLPFSFSNIYSFDTTRAFDTSLVTEYLDGTTTDPLVSGRNETLRSDLRIFSSDGNVTMRALSNPKVYRERCKILFERMINTVPKGVQLTDVIELIPEKPQQAALRIVNGTLTFFTVLRIARPAHEEPVDPSLVTLYYCDRYGDAANCQSGTANRIRGAGLSAPPELDSPIMIGLGKKFQYYYFQAPIDPSRSVSHFWWEVSSKKGPPKPRVINNGGKNYPLLQDDIFQLPVLTNVINQQPSENFTTLFTYFVVTAVKEQPNPSRVYADLFGNIHLELPLGAVLNITVDFAPNATIPSVPGYKIYTSQFDIMASAPTADFHVDADGKTTTFSFQPVGFQMPEQIIYNVVPLGKVEVVRI